MPGPHGILKIYNKYNVGSKIIKYQKGTLEKISCGRLSEYNLILRMKY